MKIHHEYRKKRSSSRLAGSRIVGIGVLLVLTLELLFTMIPAIPNSFAEPPLPAIQPIVATKTYDANLLRTQVRTVIALRAELNGTVIFSHNNNEAFRIFAPNGLIGLTALLKNETYAIVGVNSGSFFIQEKWKLNALWFKMELCWNLPLPTTLRLPLSRVDSFSGNVFTISDLKFDWNDAVASGFVVTYSNSTKSITVNVPTSGCLDPTITTSQTNSQLFQQSERVRYSAGRWYALACQAENNGPARVRSSGDGGGTWNSGNTVTGHTTTGEDCGTNHSFYLDGSHIFYTYARCCAGQKDAWFRRINYTSSGVLTNETTVLVDTSATDCNGDGLFYPTVTVNSTGYPFLFATRITDSSPCSQGAANISYGALYMPNDIKGTSWTKYDFQIQATDWSVVIISKILDGGSGRLRIAFNNGTSIYTRTWHQGNRSFGSIVAIPSSTTGLNTNNWDCEATSDFVLHCLYQRSNVLYYRNVTLSGTLGTEVAMSSSITGNFYPTVSKGSGNNTIFISTLFDSIDKIAWNRSSTNLAWIEKGTTSVDSTAVELAVSSISKDSDNGWGYYVTTGSVSPYSIAFQTLPVQIIGWGTDIAVMNSADHEREPHIVASTKSNTLVAVAIQDQSGGPICSTKASTNGGDSWSSPSTIPKQLGDSRSGDPAIATNSTGGFTMICLEIGQGVDDGKEKIYISSSKDGITWSTPQMVAEDNGLAVRLDKPWIAIDSNQSSPYKDHVYACWTTFNRNADGTQTLNTTLWFSRILPTPLPKKALFNATFTHGSQIGCNLAIGTNGELYVPWFNYQLGGPYNATLQFRWNDRGGEDWGWGRIQNVTSFRRLVNSANCLPVADIGRSDCLKGTVTSYFRIGFMPGLAVDMKGGVHLVYAENVTTGGIRNGDIKYVNSDDCRKGSRVDRCSWNTPITINLDTSDRDQFLPTIQVSNITSQAAPRGVIYVTALDRRNDPANVTWQVWSYTCTPGTSLSGSGSCRGTNEWSNDLVSDEPIDNHNENVIGDYNGITRTKTREAYPVWVDDRQYGSPNNKLFDIYGDWSRR